MAAVGKGSVSACDLLTCDYVNQISRTVSITFGIRPIKYMTFYCDQFRDVQLRVARCNTCADDGQ